MAFFGGPISIPSSNPTPMPSGPTRGMLRNRFRQRPPTPVSPNPIDDLQGADPGPGLAAPGDILGGQGISSLNQYDKFLLGYDDQKIDQMLMGLLNQGVQQSQGPNLSTQQIQKLLNTRSSLRSGDLTLWGGDQGLLAGVPSMNPGDGWTGLNGGNPTPVPGQAAWKPWQPPMGGPESRFTDPVEFGSMIAKNNFNNAKPVELAQKTQGDWGKPKNPGKMKGFGRGPGNKGQMGKPIGFSAF